MEIQEILENHSVKVLGLLRKYKISGPLSMDTIRKAHDLKGESFMLELLQIITPTSSYSTDLMVPKTGQLVASIPAEKAQPATGKGWAFWDNLLNYATKTGETIGAVKTGVSGQSAEETAAATIAAAENTSKSNMLYFVAAGFVALIIIILILKK